MLNDNKNTGDSVFKIKLYENREILKDQDIMTSQLRL